MKLKQYNLIYFIALAFLLQSFDDSYLKKRITDKSFKYEFYTTDKKIRPKSDIIYYWFKGGAIHNSEEGIAGELLNDVFDKFYLNNQLAEHGRFKNGKKVGLWRTWYSNGILASEEEWSGGQKNGRFFYYSDTGILITKGFFRADRKQGKWINYLTKDTLTYKNDVVYIKKVKKNKSKELKTDEKNIQGVESKQQKALSKPPKKTKSNNQLTEKKDGFFKRLFSKKNKTNPQNVKGT